MSHSTFRLRAVESVVKCSWECFHEGMKSRPLDVPLSELLSCLIDRPENERTRCSELDHGRQTHQGCAAQMSPGGSAGSPRRKLLPWNASSWSSSARED